MPTEDANRIPHAGVNFPPPFYFVIGFLVGWFLHRVVPLRVPASESDAMNTAGWILIIAGIALVNARIGTRVLFVRERREVAAPSASPGPSRP